MSVLVHYILTFVCFDKFQLNLRSVIDENGYDLSEGSYSVIWNGLLYIRSEKMLLGSGTRQGPEFKPDGCVQLFRSWNQLTVSQLRPYSTRSFLWSWAFSWKVKLNAFRPHLQEAWAWSILAFHGWDQLDQSGVAFRDLFVLSWGLCSQVIYLESFFIHLRRSFGKQCDSVIFTSFFRKFHEH